MIIYTLMLTLILTSNGASPPPKGVTPREQAIKQMLQKIRANKSSEAATKPAQTQPAAQEQDNEHNPSTESTSYRAHIQHIANYPSYSSYITQETYAAQDEDDMPQKPSAQDLAFAQTPGPDEVQRLRIEQALRTMQESVERSWQEARAKLQPDMLASFIRYAHEQAQNYIRSLQNLLSKQSQRKLLILFTNWLVQEKNEQWTDEIAQQTSTGKLPEAAVQPGQKRQERPARVATDAAEERQRRRLTQEEFETQEQFEAQEATAATAIQQETPRRQRQQTTPPREALQTEPEPFPSQAYASMPERAEEPTGWWQRAVQWTKKRTQEATQATKKLFGYE